MALSPIFKIRKEATPGLLDLLTSTTLGTNGAKYKHLDTSQRIFQADDPIFLSMERNKKVIGNVTFCRRGEFWYVRYFAFSSFVQAGNVKKTQDKGQSFLKRELNQFFDEVFEGKHSENPVHSMYAYIDPKNDRSKWMSENFGFSVIAQLATQSYSRVSPKASKRLSIVQDWNEIRLLVEQNYGKHHYFLTTHAEKPPFYVIKDELGEIIACTRVTRVHWEIVRLPGKWGGFLTKMIPYIPLLNRLIKPKNHTFLVPEIVCAKDNDPKILDELFSGILHKEGLHLILWWIDSKDPLYVSLQHRVGWGLLNKIIGVAPVDVVERTAQKGSERNTAPVFVTAYDMV
ncbi:MAG: hypothetical protein ACK46O_10115 [Flavobacteriia bacterium]|jgi:hypothetical protein